MITNFVTLISFSTNNTKLKNEIANCPEGPKEYKCFQEGTQEA